jgi:hypothetical protein
VSEQVMEIDALRRRALELLRRHDSHMPTGAVALALGVPLYAADRALECCYLAHEATFVAGAGWRALPAESPAAADSDGRQMDLAGGQ